MRSKHFKHIADVLLGIGLLLLMSYQVTGESGHEWTGIVMTVLMILLTHRELSGCHFCISA